MQTIIFFFALYCSYQTLACMIDTIMEKSKSKNLDIYALVSIILWTVLFSIKQ